MNGELQAYRLTIWVEGEPNLLRRIDILNAAFYRIISTPPIRLLRVHRSDYRAGVMEMDVDAPKCDPSIVPGEVRARFEPRDIPKGRTLERSPGSDVPLAETDEGSGGSSDRSPPSGSCS